MDWRKVLAYITGAADEELLRRNEYLAAENRMLMERLKGRLRLTDPQRRTLAEIGYRLGRQALADVVNVVKPESILGWLWPRAARLRGSRQTAPKVLLKHVEMILTTGYLCWQIAIHAAIGVWKRPWQCSCHL